MKEHKSDIALIKSYLNGELSAEEMYKLERRAQQDPLLMDMMQGMEKGAEDWHAENLSDIKQRMRQRLHTPFINRRKPNMLWWMAATITGALFVVGYWFLKKEAIPQATLVQEQKQGAEAQDKVKKDSTPMVAMKPREEGEKTTSTAEQVSSKAPPQDKSKTKSAKEQKRQLAANRGSKSDSLFNPAAKMAIAALIPKDDAKSIIGQRSVRDEDSAETLKRDRGEYETSHVVSNRDSLLVAMHPANALNEVTVSGYDRRNRASVSSKLATRMGGVHIAHEIPAARTVAEPVIGWKAYDDYLEASTQVTMDSVGTVGLAFRLNKEGKPEKIRITKSVDPKLDKRAIEILENGPRWKKMDMEQEVSINVDFNN